MDCFQYFETQAVKAEDILLLEKGSMPFGGYIADRFQKRVVQTVDAMLKRYVKRFNRSLKEAMEMGDFQSIPFLCERTQKEIAYCYFYEHIIFLDKPFAVELSEEVNKQRKLFWLSVLHEMERIHKETCHPELEDIIYLLKRMNKSGVRHG